MFGFISSQSGSLRRNLVWSVFALFVVLLSAGCPEQTEPGSLHGTWLSEFPNDTFIIDTLKDFFERPNEFTGKIINSPDYDAAAGVLIIEITKYWEADLSNYPDVITTETTSNNGKFTAVYWKTLTDSSVQLSIAYEGFVHVIFETLSEAQTKFTMDRVSLYTGYWGTYTK